MNRRRIAYLLAIVVLLLPLAYLSRPASVQDAGGALAKLRGRYGLGQSDLGAIDPSSEAMKLGTFGLRVVAISLLWNRAEALKDVENWTQLAATLEQLTKLAPNVVSFWDFQSWNVSYNVSVEFEDLRDQYYWIVKGIKFLQEGARYNPNEPSLQWDIGWFTSQKIGKADNHKYYRQFFREDDLFHGPRPRQERDNWLVGREAFLKAEEVVDRVGYSIKGVSRADEQKQRPRITPLLFHSDPPMCLRNYAHSLEEEGTFGDQARRAWRRADEDWRKYGQRELRTIYNTYIRLADYEKYEAAARQALAELEALVPAGTRQKIEQQRLASLTAAQRSAWQMSSDLRNDEQQRLAGEAGAKMRVTHADVAALAPEAQRAAALRAAETATAAEETARQIDSDRQVVNYEHWLVRGAAEATENAVRGREALYQAQTAHKAARLAESARRYEQGFQEWRLVLDKFPELDDANEATDDLALAIADYQRLLDELDRPFPKPFLLQNVIDTHPLEVPAAVGPR